MDMAALRHALNLFLRYGNGDVEAAHDVIFAGPDGVTPDRMESGDLEQLHDMGWTWDIGHQYWKCGT